MSDEFRCKDPACKDRESFKNQQALRMHNMRAHDKKSVKKWKESQIRRSGRKESEPPKSDISLEDAILSTFSSHPGEVLTRQQLVESALNKGVGKSAVYLSAVVTKYLKGNPERFEKVGRGQYACRIGASKRSKVLSIQAVGRGLRSRDAVVSQVMETTESPEMLRTQRDAARARCQMLQEMLMRVIMDPAV